uniref:SIMPL domain-containing protein n=1 Tax=Aestuariivita boseongensis TaxID=1470562 RepID=UPI000682CD0F
MRFPAIMLSAALVILSHPVAWAEEAMRVITVTGQGQVFAEPDMATVSVGVTHEDKEASAAMAKAADGAAKILARVEEAGIAPRDVQTGSITLNPVWNNRSASSEVPRITGFVASISVTIRVRDLPKLGGVLDAVVTDGANQLGGISFGMQDPKPLMEEARRQAVADGRAKAEVLAEAAGVTLGALQSLNEQ